MAVQDDERERQLVLLFNLTQDEERQRHGIDALLELDDVDHPIPFELKSTSKSSVSTVRDFNEDHVRKWSDLHWIIGFYDGRGTKLRECVYLSPTMMRPWIEAKWEYIKPDRQLAHRLPSRVTMDDLVAIAGEKERYTLADARRIHKQQYSALEYKAMKDLPDGYTPEAMLRILRDRAAYVTDRGSTLNNPHISKTFLASFPRIRRNHAAELRHRVREAIEDPPLPPLV